MLVTGSSDDSVVPWVGVVSEELSEGVFPYVLEVWEVVSSEDDVSVETVPVEL